MMKYLLLILIAAPALAQGPGGPHGPGGPGGFGPGGPGGPGGLGLQCSNPQQCYQAGETAGQQEAQQQEMQRRNTPMICQVSVTTGFNGGHPPGGGPGFPGSPGFPGGPGFGGGQHGPQLRTFSAQGIGETQTVLNLNDQIGQQADPMTAQAARQALKSYQYTCNR